MKSLHGMHMHMWHAPPVRNVSCARRVGRHGFSRRMSALSGLKFTCKPMESLKLWRASPIRRQPPYPDASKLSPCQRCAGTTDEVKTKFKNDNNAISWQSYRISELISLEIVLGAPRHCDLNRHSIQLVNGRSPPHLSCG